MGETLRLFDADAYCRIFTGKVIRCEEQKERFAIVLDRTAFYPEGGGQGADTGILAAGESIAHVTDTRERNGEIIHYCDAPLPVGSLCEGTIDWEKRFDRMQNHTGEHIVSGLIHQRFGYENVGFHMGSEVLTIDLSGEITDAELTEIELAANQAVWNNAAVITTVYPEGDPDLKRLEYRSKKELHGMVRIVTIPDTDICACCGTHVKRTGEVGLIRLLGAEKFRGGVRIGMLCGKRALLYDRGIWEQNHRISVLLSAKALNTSAAVERLKKEADEKSYRVIFLEERSFERTAQDLSGAGDCLLLTGKMESESVRKLAVCVMESCGGTAAVFAGEDGNGYHYAVGCKDGDLRELTKSVNAELSGKGGGKPFFVQGNVSASAAEILPFFEQRYPGMRVVKEGKP